METKTLFDTPEHRLKVEVNRTVPPEDELRLSKQALKILSMLRQGRVSNVQMQSVAMQYNTRLKEIREALRPLGLTVPLVERCPGGLNWYQLKRSGLQ